MFHKIRKCLFLRKLSSNLTGFRLALLLLCCLPVCEISAQKDTIKVLQKDNRAIIPNYPSTASMEEIYSDRDYQYNKDTAPPENPLARWFYELWKKFQSLFSGKSYENFWQYVLMATALVLVLFVLYKAKVFDYIFPLKEKDSVQEYVIGQENIHEMNLDHALDDALATGDFRLAIRLQYLRILKKLSEKELINWQPNRTNHSYFQELEKHLYQADFARITRYFEFAWYGDFKIDKAEYEEMKAFSDAFNDNLNQRAYV